MVPLSLTFHCWLAPPLQSQIRDAVPLPALAGTSRHLPRTCRAWPVRVNCWLLLVWQSQTMVAVPLAEFAPLTSRQRPADSLRRRKLVGVGVVSPVKNFHA